MPEVAREGGTPQMYGRRNLLEKETQMKQSLQRKFWQISNTFRLRENCNENIYLFK